MYKIKLSVPGFGNKLDISQYIGNRSDNAVGDYKFFINDPDCRDPDYWFVLDDLNEPQESSFISKSNIFFLSAEVAIPIGYYDSQDKRNFLDQFSFFYTCHDIYRDNAKNTLPFLSWMINANHGPSIFQNSARDLFWFKGLNSLQKNKLISVFCSTKTITPDHYLRLKFVKRLKSHFGNDLDWFGNGVNPLAEKWNGIAPYKYHITLENQSRHNVITEKLYDAYLGLSFPIYWGAPNAASYFPSGSFASINPYDPYGAIHTIEELISSNAWENNLDCIINSKNLVLLNHNPFYRMIDVVSNALVQGETPKEQVTIFNMRHFALRSASGLLKYSTNRATSFLNKLAVRLDSE